MPRTIRGKAIPVRVFALKMAGQDLEVALDASGWLVDHRDYRRVD